MQGQIGRYNAELFEDVDLVSTDVFDTLLLRTHRSERSRIMAAEQLFALVLERAGHSVSATLLVAARLEAQRLAYRSLDMAGGGEVRLVDIIRRQLAILGLPNSFVAARVAIEIEIERQSLRPNLALADALRRCRSGGKRVVAVSDIALPTAALETLITAFHGADLVDRVYSSADMATTKRRGDLFDLVMREEAVQAGRILHIGDDEAADHRIPSMMGMQTLYVPRAELRRYLTRAHGGVAELGHRARKRDLAGRIRAGTTADPTAFGREVLGPIVAEFCLAIWLYADEAQRKGNAVLLFCARGGLGIREAFERVLSRLGLPLALPRENLAVSRLVAARAAMMARSPAALDELGREFGAGSFADVAQVLAGRAHELPPAWSQRFRGDQFYTLLDSAAGQGVVADVAVQDGLFRRHLADMCGSAERIILCDTGLYGSTQRLLSAGIPERSFETIQFARCNYKNFDEDHFPRVAGLAVERNCYSSFDVRSTVLRYWHLIESLFEPRIPSVKTFADDAGAVSSNAGDIGYGSVAKEAVNPRLIGVLDYIDSLSGGMTVIADAPRAWAQLKRAIVRPAPADLQALAIGTRSVDFGRPGMVGDRTAPQTGVLSQLSSINTQLWREGAVAREFPRSRAALLGSIETFHALRGFSSWIRH
ncbi:hydrolase [Bosea sp. BIWAKO-01]|uniref:hydrolase n=1 Tax=Bosea sp. BIWAKO-01 TaxID=506668 RepID=UPI0008535A75|nr:hydrolase [Bosea sp. BIWAKO-01]